MFARFSVDFSSIFRRCLLGFLSIFWPYCDLILIALSCVCIGTSTSPLCAPGFVHPQVVPLIVPSHLSNVPLIVAWLNKIVCNQVCTVFHNTLIISKLNLEKHLSVCCRFSVDVYSVFCRFFVYLLSMFAWFSVDILSVLCPYCLACVHRIMHKSALRPRIRPPTSGTTYSIVPLIKHPTYCFMTECNHL